MDPNSMSFPIHATFTQHLPYPSHLRDGYSRLTRWLCITTHFCPLTSDSSQILAPSLKPYSILMSRASISSKRSRRRSKDSSRDGVHLDKQPPPEMDTIRSVDDKEKNCKPLVDKSSSAMSASLLQCLCALLTQIAAQILSLPSHQNLTYRKIPSMIHQKAP
ncbi:hypothetical protein BDR07DRAFT_71389 [Suillus spraguei]|nr:hypothetical protein BDR07DRAFT_71389 [Suillus spraguei]